MVPYQKQVFCRMVSGSKSACGEGPIVSKSGIQVPLKIQVMMEQRCHDLAALGSEFLQDSLLYFGRHCHYENMKNYFLTKQPY